MSKNLLPIDEMIAHDLRERVQESGATYRELAAATGMSINRIGIILRQESPPATVGELGAIARAAGSTASEVLARAERAVASRDDYDLVANDTINEFPDGDDADFDQA